MKKTGNKFFRTLRAKLARDRKKGGGRPQRPHPSNNYFSTIVGTSSLQASQFMDGDAVNMESITFSFDKYKPPGEHLWFFP